MATILDTVLWGDGDWTIGRRYDRESKRESFIVTDGYITDYPYLLPTYKIVMYDFPHRVPTHVKDAVKEILIREATEDATT